MRRRRGVTRSGEYILCGFSLWQLGGRDDSVYLSIVVFDCLDLLVEYVGRCSQVQLQLLAVPLHLDPKPRLDRVPELLERLLQLLLAHE